MCSIKANGPFDPLSVCAAYFLYLLYFYANLKMERNQQLSLKIYDVMWICHCKSLSVQTAIDDFTWITMRLIQCHVQL